MDVSRYVSILKSRLYPEVYSQEMGNLPTGLHLLLTQRRGWIARYAFAVTTWDDSQDGAAFLAERRQWVTQVLKARWLCAEVGLYLVVLGQAPDWRDRLSEMPADLTGLHATIVQAVHYINMQTGEFDTNQSAWGPVTFGSVGVLADFVASVPVAN